MNPSRERRLVFFAGPEAFGTGTNDASEKGAKEQAEKKESASPQIVEKETVDKRATLQAAEKEDKTKEQAQLKELGQKMDAQLTPEQEKAYQSEVKALRESLRYEIQNLPSSGGETNSSHYEGILKGITGLNKRFNSVQRQFNKSWQQLAYDMEIPFSLSGTPTICAQRRFLFPDRYRNTPCNLELRFNSRADELRVPFFRVIMSPDGED